MTLLAPAFLAIAGLAALAVVAMHFLARRRPPAATFPTARFVPDRAVRATSRAPRPTDLLLLALRVLVVLLVGAAFAGLAKERARRASARVILVDRSRAVGAAAALRDSALAHFRPGDVVVLADSQAVVLDDASAADTLRTLAPLDVRGSLGAGIVVAQREAVRLGASADTVHLVIVSPLVAESFDSATLAVRRGWPGRVSIARVAAREPAPPPRIALRAAADDPIAASVALLALEAESEAEATVRLVRDRPAGGDSAWAADRDGRVLVVWPVRDGVLPVRAVSDTVGGVGALGAVVVAPFVRGSEPGDGRVVARWVDGASAASERALGEGCERDVAIPIAARGDLALRPEMLALVRALAAPCGGAVDVAPVPDSVVARLVSGDDVAGESIGDSGDDTRDDTRHDTRARPRDASAGRAGTAASRAVGSVVFAPWLLGAALLLALAEPLFRRQRGTREEES